MDLFSHAPKPNTRIPPILFARQKNKEETATTASARCTKLATLSKQKLSKETSTGDPDLRRCLGHHRLLRRSIQEAQEDMKRYLGEVVQYESDSDDEEEEEEEEGDDDIIGPASDGEEEVEEEGGEDLFDAYAKVHKKEVVFLGPRGRAREVDIPRREAPPPEAVTRARSVCVREKIADAVRGLMRRHTSPLPLPLHLRAVAAGKQDGGGASLRHTLQKNNSCSDIPIYIHVHGHVGKGDTFAAGLEKTRTSEMQTEPRALRVRGRKYAERLGIRRR
ncbi:hypothetical protein BJY01DRAFT_248289 [Aspergillus pseudoustus]|uniref:Uncharacterized protein n=1 Tax=Aspergillus pseudoustus TaxID=1810923 RepID=A0ABR4JZ21_9EURO